MYIRYHMAQRIVGMLGVATGRGVDNRRKFRQLHCMPDRALRVVPTGPETRCLLERTPQILKAFHNEHHRLGCMC